MSEKMTVFYRKSNGDLGDILQDIQDMSIYGDLQADYSLIYDFIIVDFDEYVMINKRFFCIVDGAIKVKEADAIELQKYM